MFYDGLRYYKMMMFSVVIKYLILFSDINCFYLGQSYEVKLKKLGELGEYRGVKLKVNIEINFSNPCFQLSG